MAPYIIGVRTRTVYNCFAVNAYKYVSFKYLFYRSKTINSSDALEKTIFSYLIVEFERRRRSYPRGIRDTANCRHSIHVSIIPHVAWKRIPKEKFWKYVSRRRVWRVNTGAYKSIYDDETNSDFPIIFFSPSSLQNMIQNRIEFIRWQWRWYVGHSRRSRRL